MRLSLVTDTFPPDVNGVALTLRRLRDMLVSRGHAVEVVLPGDLWPHSLAAGAVGAEDPAGMLKLPSFPLPGYKGLRFGLPAKGALRKHWRAHPPEIVYVATESPLGFSAADVSHELGIPVVSGFHTNFDTYMQHYKVPMLRELAGGYLRSLHNRTAATFAPSPDVMDRLQAEGFRNVKHLGRGVDTAFFDPARRDPDLRASWGMGEGDAVALYVGRVAAEKNLSLAVRAFEDMRRLEEAAGRRFRAVIVGDGPKRAEIEKSHPEFHFAGMRTGPDLAAHYASADVFVFPSVSETFGNVIIEAMASGLAVVSFHYAAALLHLRPGQNGLSAPLGDEPAFLEACRNALDRSLWPSLRAQARRTAESLGWEAVVERFEKDLEEILLTC